MSEDTDPGTGTGTGARAGAPPVLITGAGPTGLAAACTLLRHGVPVRVVERRSGPSTTPKALILWSGALEVLDRLGIAAALAERALPLAGASYWSGGRRVAEVGFGSLTGTRFPGPLCVPQPITEELLYERLIQLGGTVEWDTEVKAATSTPDGATAVLRTAHGAGGEETATARWLIAADGTHSTVRTGLGVPFEGSTYGREFLLGDAVLHASGAVPPPEREAQYHLTPRGVLVVVALPKGGHRVFFDQAPGGATEPPDRAELQTLLDARGPGGWRIGDLWWSSRFQVHTKVAAAFRRDAVFLAGDAAHCHSPAGGQGLNTGVQDGYDIGWKLAAVCRGADPALLDSYEAERRPTAVTAVRNADRQTKLWLLRSRPARAVRDTAMRVLSRRGLLERRFVPELAQVDLDLTGSPAVSAADGTDGALRPGRRVPDLPLTLRHTRAGSPGAGAATLHQYLAAGRHTVVVLADTTDSGPDAARRCGTAEVLLIGGTRPGAPAPPTDTPYDRAEAAHGYAAQAVYVRPDGVVGGRAVLGGPGSPAALDALLARLPDRNGDPWP
ncbi:FAD-dependent monooxygenase [Streptomyces xiamenensis]